MRHKVISVQTWSATNHYRNNVTTGGVFEAQTSLQRHRNIRITDHTLNERFGHLLISANKFLCSDQ